MLNTIYANQSQFTDLLNAIQGGDTTAIATALGQIKTSIDAINTSLGSLSTGVTQDSTQWSDLITAIGSGGGGGGGTIDIDATQWSNLLTEIAKGDTSALATLLTTIAGHLAQIKLDLDAVAFDTTQWNALITAVSRSIVTAGVTQDATQWSNLLTSVDKGDMTSANNALGNMDTSLSAIDTYAGSIATDTAAIATALGSLGITQNATQWSNLINAINAFNAAYQSNVILGTTLDGRPTSTGVSLDLFNSAFNTSPQWTVITNSYIDIYLYKMGILKILWFDVAKSQIPSGWTPGGLQQLPSGYEALLSPPININNTMRNGTQVTMTVNNTGMFSINPSATIAANTQVRLSFIYI